MAYLPFQDSTELATRSDLDAFEERLAGCIDLVDQRFILALVAGLVAIIATLVAQSFL